MSGMKNPQDRINIIAYLHTPRLQPADPRAQPEGGRAGRGRRRAGEGAARRSGRRRRGQADRGASGNAGHRPTADATGGRRAKRARAGTS